MTSFLKKLWADDAGTVLAAEWVFVATILILGAITGLMASRQAAIQQAEQAAAESFTIR